MCWPSVRCLLASARGVEVDASSIRFVASQPWLFPRSLLLGFTARATDDRIDFDAEELEDLGALEGLKMTAGATRDFLRRQVGHAMFQMFTVLTP